jgi:hypothetical protein
MKVRFFKTGDRQASVILWIGQDEESRPATIQDTERFSKEWEKFTERNGDGFDFTSATS